MHGCCVRELCQRKRLVVGLCIKATQEGCTISSGLGSTGIQLSCGGIQSRAQLSELAASHAALLLHCAALRHDLASQPVDRVREHCGLADLHGHVVGDEAIVCERGPLRRPEERFGDWGGEQRDEKSEEKGKEKSREEREE